MRATRPEPSITIYPSPLRLVLLAAGSIVFVACGLMLALAGDSAVAIGVGWISIVFFGVAGTYLLLRLVRQQPLLVLDGRGITDHASGFGVGFVSWAEVVAVAPVQMGRQHMATVYVTDPAALRRRFGAVRQRLMRANTTLTGGSVQIPTVMMPFGIDELLAVIEELAPDHVQVGSRGRHAR